MTTTQMQSVKFDPGYAQHTTILSISLEYIYSSINSYKNFGQKKAKFKMLYPQILRMVDNNVGFCLGSLLWAVYIKSLGDIIGFFVAHVIFKFLSLYIIPLSFSGE